MLKPGRYFNWPKGRQSIFKLRKTELIHRSAVVDVTSSDRLVYRMSAALKFLIVDPREASENSHVEKIELAVAAALPRLASERTLEALLTERSSLDAELLRLMPSSIAGCEITSVTIAALVLPPEVRRLYAEVERARLEGIAALERARGEQASLRSLANAARMLKGNPELVNLRMLQVLGSKGGATLVLGSNAILPASADAEQPTAI